MNIICSECFGEGVTSDCCGESVDRISKNKYQCSSCMKFCRVDYCDRCYLLDNLNNGDDVDIFLCVYSSKNLTKYKPFNIKGYKYGDSRYEKVKFIKFVNDYYAIIRHPKMNKNIKIEIDDITM